MESIAIVELTDKQKSWFDCAEGRDLTLQTNLCFRYSNMA